jgi:hypothetical protein
MVELANSVARQMVVLAQDAPQTPVIVDRIEIPIVALLVALFIGAAVDLAPSVWVNYGARGAPH